MCVHLFEWVIDRMSLYALLCKMKYMTNNCTKGRNKNNNKLIRTKTNWSVKRNRREYWQNSMEVHRRAQKNTHSNSNWSCVVGVVFVDGLVSEVNIDSNKHTLSLSLVHCLSTPSSLLRVSSTSIYFIYDKSGCSGGGDGGVECFSWRCFTAAILLIEPLFMRRANESNYRNLTKLPRIRTSMRFIYYSYCYCYFCCCVPFFSPTLLVCLFALSFRGWVSSVERLFSLTRSTCVIYDGIGSL